MSDKAIIQGSLVDVRNVNQHKCVRMLIDVPAELAPKVMEAFGWPTMANPVPVAIAHLAEEPKTRVTSGGDETTFPPEKPKRNWSQLSRAEQAGIACNDPDFVRYLAMEFNPKMEAPAVVRWYCDVESRSDLDKFPRSGQKWDELYSNYQRFQRGAAA